MDVIAIYDHYFLDAVRRRFDDRCEYGLCEKSIVFRRMRAAVDERRGGGGATRLSDVLEYMAYNVPCETGLPAHYSCCMYLYKDNGGGRERPYECGHVCNAIPLMVGSRLEEKVVGRLAEMLGVPPSEVCDAGYLHRVYAGSFLVNGTFYYSLFRESNNNKICHNSKSKYRGDETVAYFYDNACNRGVKLFTDGHGRLRVNDRDGNEVADVTADVMLQLYTECPYDSRLYTLDMDLVRGFFAAVKRRGVAGIDDFKNKIYTNYSIGLNAFMDKLPSDAMCNPMWNASLMAGKINLGISQRLVYPGSKAEAKKQNEQKLKMCSGSMSTGYLVDAQRRRNVRKTRPASPTAGPSGDFDVAAAAAATTAPGVRKRRACGDDGRDRGAGTRADDVHRPPPPPAPWPEHTVLGSKDVKTPGLMERLDRGERTGPSIFNQVSVSYLPLVRALSGTVQKLQVEHVHAESSKTVPRDAYGFICMKYVGNIATAGKNMLFTDRVQVSYGHVREAVTALERGIGRLALTDLVAVVTTGEARTAFEDGGVHHGTRHDPPRSTFHVVINNAVTRWTVPRYRLVEFVVRVKTRCHRFAWTKVVGDYLCVYYYEGVPLLRYDRGELMFDLLRRSIAAAGGGGDGGGGGGGPMDGVAHLYFSRDELETLAVTADGSFAARVFSRSPRHAAAGDVVDRTNAMIDRLCARWRDDDGDGGGYDEVSEPQCTLARHLDQYTAYTAPAKRSVSVNARKSGCVNVYYQRAADLIRGFNVFTDPDGYEAATARRLAAAPCRGPPEWVTMRDLVRARADADNCPQPQYGGGGDDRSLRNFYMMRTAFADVDGHNVEDANVLDASVDLHLSYSYSFSLTFVDRTEKGLDVIVPPPRNAACVCCWDGRGEPTTVMFVVCTVRKRDGEGCSGTDVGDMLRASTGARMVDVDANVGNDVDDDDDDHYDNDDDHYDRNNKRNRRTRGDVGAAAVDDTVHFPPFRKLSVLRSAEGHYHVYFMRDDAVLLRSVRDLRRRTFGGADAAATAPDTSNATRLAEDAYAFACRPEVNAYDALTSLETTVTTFDADGGGRVVTVDVRVHGRSDKYDGVKIVNGFGQKGLALIRDLRPYFPPPPPSPTALYDVPVQLVMNNCSFVSRRPIGQYLQMKKNMYGVVASAAGEPTAVGYTPVFITETEPVTKTCLVRFDEMMRSVIVTLGLTVFQNLKNSLDNVYNPYGVLYPPHARHILGLYRCVGVSYKFAGDEAFRPFSTRREVDSLMDVYREFDGVPKPARTDGAKALSGLAAALSDGRRRRRLLDTGLLRETRFRSGACVHTEGAEDGRDGGRPAAGTPACRCKSYSFGREYDVNSQAVAGARDFHLRIYEARHDRCRTVYLGGGAGGDTSLVADALDALDTEDGGTTSF